MNTLPELNEMPSTHINEVFGQIIAEEHKPEILKKVQACARTKWFNVNTVDQFRVGTAIAITIPANVPNGEVALRTYALFEN